ncbi:YceI family protein [Phenylobacterium sp. LjRoot225]|uniref:YceI family protein n=1 Tax=Phenylobacterium sp. LjRoot225 TaxID=3342285 RepID=UPI003ECD8C40
MDATHPRAQTEGARYAAGAILLHWLIAALIVLQVVLATRMEDARTPATFALFQLHKSVGITVLLLSLVRLAWRLVHPPPPLPATLAPWERRLAHWTHVGLYVVMLGMPLTGWIMVSTSRIAIPTLLYGQVPWPMIPGLPDLSAPAKAVWHEVGETGHKLIIRGAFVLVALHVAGALKHQLFRGDEPVLARMAPGAVPGRWLEPRLLAIVLAVAAVVAFGATVRPPEPRMSAATLAPPVQAPAPQASRAPIPAEAPRAPAERPPAPPAPPPPQAAAAPVRWTVVPGSRLVFESAWGGEPVRGVFKRWRADILFSPEALDRSRIVVTVDMTSADTGDGQRDAALPSADWFDSARHPKAVFTTDRIRKRGEGSFVAEGTLDLKGIARPVSLPFELSIQGERAEARGIARVNRTRFGVGQGEFAAADQIPEEVRVSIDVKARTVR